MPNYEDIIQQSQENVNSLKVKLNDFDNLYKDILSQKEASQGISDSFDVTFKEIVKRTEVYMASLHTATKLYVEDNNTYFLNNLKDFADKIISLNKEIDRLLKVDISELFKDLQTLFIDKTSKDLEVEFKKLDVKTENLQLTINEFQTQIERLENFDLTKLFEELQTIFIYKTKESLEIEFKKLDDKTKNLQSKINEFQLQIERLEKFDLQIEFDKLQNTLSEIFNAINNINITFGKVIHTLNDLGRTLGNIQSSIEDKHKETKIDIASVSKNIADLSLKVDNNNTDITNLIKAQNVEIETIKTVAIFTIGILVIGLIIVIAKVW